MRYMTVHVSFKFGIRADEGVELSQIMAELERQFSDSTGQAEIEDDEMLDYELIDSR